MHSCRGENNQLIQTPTTGFLRADGTEGGIHSGDKRFYENMFRPAAEKEGIQKCIGWHTFRHSYSTLLRSVGTEFKVMQELLRHSMLPSTLEVYTQAVTPAKHAAQAAVLSLVFLCEANATSPPSVSGGVAA